VPWLCPYPHTAEFCDEGVGVRVIRKAKARVLHDFQHTASSIGGLIVPTAVAEFVYFANAIGGGDLDRDLMGKIAINLPLRDLTFASDHRRQKVKSKTPQMDYWPATTTTRDPLYQRDSGVPNRDGFACQSPECQPPNVRHHERALTAAKFWSAQLRTVFKR
jgi:hypothetical protein